LRLGSIWDLAIDEGLGGELAPEPYLYLPGIENVYHPDLVYRSPDSLEICQHQGIEGTPDVICEILSPTTEKVDRYTKMEDFRRADVPHVWLIDPNRPVTIEGYVLESNGHYRQNSVVRAPAAFHPAVFPGWSISMAELGAVAAPALSSRGTAVPSDGGSPQWVQRYGHGDRESRRKRSQKGTDLWSRPMTVN
jgi:Uma2 family endonuclease